MFYNYRRSHRIVKQDSLILTLNTSWRFKLTFKRIEGFKFIELHLNLNTLTTQLNNKISEAKFELLSKENKDMNIDNNN